LLELFSGFENSQRYIPEKESSSRTSKIQSSSSQFFLIEKESDREEKKTYKREQTFSEERVFV